MLAHFFGRSAHGNRHWDIDQVVPDADAIAAGEFERSVVWSLERFDDVPGLAFHDGDLAGEHALFEIGIELEAIAELDLRVGPPFLGCKKW